MGMSLQKYRGSQDVAEFAIDLTEIKEVYTEILETQSELGGTILYRAKIPSGGGKAFDIETGDASSDVSVTSFAGVIVYDHSANAYFGEQDMSNTPPICSSLDGVIGFNTACGKSIACKGCPLNEYGTAKNGRGKACKNMRRLYIMTEGLPLPVILTLPPTSLTSFANYRLSSLAAKKLKPNEVVTEFSIEVDTNEDGIKYSKVLFNRLGKLSPEQAEIARYFSGCLEAAAKAIDVEGEDYNREKTEEE